MKKIPSNKYTTLLLLVGGLFFSSCQSSTTQERASMIIAFGSCNRTDHPQIMWEPLASHNPDVFIWLGDIIYADTHDMDHMQAEYDKVMKEPGYQKLKESANIIGVWDDHDYGWNDAGKNYSKRDSSKQILMDFLDIDPNDEIRSREGIYTSYVFGDHPIQTKVILLDTRYFRDTVIHDPDPSRRYTTNVAGDILGETQWNWLATELENSEADIHIIGSGIQVIPNEHGFEKWGNFPKSRTRLFELLRQKQPKNTLLISGDRHMAEFSKIKLKGKYEVYEITSSGLTHTWSAMWEESNRYRIGDMVIRKNFGLILIDPYKIEMQIRGELDSLYKTLEIPLL
jgi:alkaline phosphatase D